MTFLLQVCCLKNAANAVCFGVLNFPLVAPYAKSSEMDRIFTCFEWLEDSKLVPDMV